MWASFHHYIPTSKGWTEDRNINWDHINSHLHNGIHWLFWNATPCEKVLKLITETKGLSIVKKEPLLQLLYSEWHQQNFYLDDAVSN